MSFIGAREKERRQGEYYLKALDIALDYGEYAEAIRNYNESLKLCRKIDNKYGIAWNLCGIAEALVRTGQLPGVMENH